MKFKAIIILAITAMSLSVYAASKKYYEYDDATSLPDAARILIYDPTLKDLNITGAELKKDVVPWVDVSHKPFFGNLSSAKVYAEANNKGLAVSTAVTYNNLTVKAPMTIIAGGSLAKSVGSTLTISGAFTAPYIQCLDDGVTFGPGSAASFIPDWWTTNTTPGTTDMTTAVQAAYNAAYAAGGELLLLNETYKTTDTVGISISLSIAGRGFPSVRGIKAPGVGDASILSTGIKDGSIIKYSGSGTAFQIVNTSATEANRFYGGVLRDFAIVKDGTGFATDGSIGLLIQGAVDWRLYNVVITGFDTGFKNYYGWSWDAFGLTAIHNTVGVLLGSNSNAVGIYGAQLHQNAVNLKATSGSGISINRATIEGASSKGIVITADGDGPAPQNITLNDLHAEANPVDAIRIGMDESDATSTTRIDNIIINNPVLSLSSGVVPIKFDYAKNVVINQPSWGQSTALISTTANTSDIKINGFNSFSNLHLDRYAYNRRVGFSNPYNLLAGGTLGFPNLYPFTVGGLSAAFDSSTFPGETVVKITVPNGTTHANQGFIVITDPRLIGRRLVFTGTAQADSGFTAQFRIYNNNGEYQAGTSATIPTSMDSVGTYIVCPQYLADGTTPVNYLKAALYVSNTSGSTKYIYVKSMIMTDANTGVVQPGPLDYLAGLSGRINATSGGTAVAAPGFRTGTFSVQLTPEGNFTTYATLGDQTFTITTSAASGVVDYLIVPRTGMQ